jgi:hypothetical protein
MQAVSQSYSSQVYSSIQNGAPFSGRPAPGQKTALDQKPSSPNSEEKVSLSADSRQLSRNNGTQGGFRQNETNQDKNSSKQQELTQKDQKNVIELQKRDKEVRIHEQAHLSAAGQYAAGGASFSYTSGPDGKRYVNSGSVPIDLGKEKTPEATIQKMRTVRRAALAPADPSGADRNIAAQASAKEAQAMKEMQSASSDALNENNNAASNNTKQDIDPTGTKNSLEDSQLSQVSDFSRKAMASAYQAVAALAS